MIKIRNSNIENRNKFKIQNSNVRNVFNFVFRSLGFVSDFGFRASNFSRRGQLMIEVLVATSLVTVGILGVFSLLTKSLGTTKFVASEYIASNLAAEGIELVKSVIESDVLQSKPFGTSLSSGSFEMDYNDTALASFGARPLLFNPTSKLYSYDSGNPTPYVRRIEIDLAPDGNNCIEEIGVKSTVEWSIRGGNFKVDVEDHFFDWRGQGSC